MTLTRILCALSKRPVLVGLAVLAAATPALAGGGGGDGHTVIINIAIALVAGSAIAFVLHLLKQPLLLGYILAGIAVGPVGFGFIADHTEIVTISELGLILLLFMIGLEIDVRAMLRAGKMVIVPGLLQFPISVGTAYLILGFLEDAGIFFGAGTYARLYVAIGVSISSTMIVVKLLFDKMEMDTLPGRIAVGMLVFQDIWAIIVLAIQPNINNPEISGIARTFGSGILLVALALLLSRFVLPTAFRLAAKVPELVLVLAMGWCFLVALVAAHPAVGLSMEMGALIAGIALAAFPYNLDIIARTTTVRDFFITLFFVALGMQIPMPTLEVLEGALLIIAVALTVRALGIFGILYSLGSGLRVSNLATINLSQVSEFSLVILTLGVGFGHIEEDTLTYLIWVFALLAVGSTYGITYSHGVQRLLTRAQRLVRLPDIGGGPEQERERVKHQFALLGFFRIADAFLQEIQRKRPELLESLMVVDLNPVVHKKLEKMGVACVYGDVSNPDTLHHAHIHDVQILVCTIPDSILRGTSNARLIKQLRGVAPHSKLVLTAETGTQARELYEAGADYVLEASHCVGSQLAATLDGIVGGTLAEERERAKGRLEDGVQELLA